MESEGKPTEERSQDHEAVRSDALLGCWFPIESAPHDGTEVDLWARGERVTNAKWKKRGYDKEARWLVWGQDDFDGMDYVPVPGPVTHWMPIPNGPAT